MWEKGTTEDEMVGQHHWLNGHDFEELVMDREAWRTALHPVAKSWTWLSNWAELNWWLSGKESAYEGRQETTVRPLDGEDPLEEEMLTDSGTLAWKIPWTEESGGPQSMGLQIWTQLSDWAHKHILYNSNSKCQVTKSRKDWGADAD